MRVKDQAGGDHKGVSHCSRKCVHGASLKNASRKGASSDLHSSKTPAGPRFAAKWEGTYFVCSSQDFRFKFHGLQLPLLPRIVD